MNPPILVRPPALLKKPFMNDPKLVFFLLLVEAFLVLVFGFLIRVDSFVIEDLLDSEGVFFDG